ncbi:hypothetical protein [Cellulosimicrobium marinum]|uniref:hypothetical protein n=1 Tax=Cellulosimicrobium marinum TaxID=1638992 RepID=UPI001E4FA7EA|nr:hypothetical protein [Cellulosimicrobium marinum]MCB7138043.1 hypothetical protein [Cellulosimicrobium marinum]
MDEQRTARSGFFTTMPGVLTAVAAIVTAVGGVYGIYVSQRSAEQPVSPPTVATGTPTPEPTTPTPEPTTPTPQPTTPAGTTEVPIIIALGDLHGEEDADTSPVEEPFAAWYLSADVDRQVVADACGAGDPTSCAVLEQVLVQDCTETFDAACDILYYVEPVGSELENLDATCGYLFGDWSLAGRCTS